MLAQKMVLQHKHSKWSVKKKQTEGGKSRTFSRPTMVQTSAREPATIVLGALNGEEFVRAIRTCVERWISTDMLNDVRFRQRYKLWWHAICRRRRRGGRTQEGISYMFVLEMGPFK